MMPHLAVSNILRTNSSMLVCSFAFLINILSLILITCFFFLAFCFFLLNMPCFFFSRNFLNFVFVLCFLPFGFCCLSAFYQHDLDIGPFQTISPASFSSFSAHDRPVMS